jgi:hypothetical protein
MCWCSDVEVEARHGCLVIKGRVAVGGGDGRQSDDPSWN